MHAFPEFAFIVFVSLIVLVGAPFEVQKRRRMREMALAQLRDSKLNSTIDQYVFNGATARLIKQEDSSFNERNGPYVLTVYAMNEHGEYFMFRSNKPNPYIKHMTQTMAKVVLKDKYIRPSSAQVIQG
jgi:hypothetical protein